MPSFWPSNPNPGPDLPLWSSSSCPEAARFYICLQALSVSTIILIAYLVEANLLPAAPNMTLRARLMAAYQLTNIKRVELLFNQPLLGRKQKLSELLVEMLRGQDNNDLFNYLLAQQAAKGASGPPHRGRHVGQEVVGTRADTHAAHHQRLAHEAGTEVAADSLEELEEESDVVAVKPNGRNGQQGGGAEADSMVEQASVGRRSPVTVVAAGADNRLPTHRASQAGNRSLFQPFLLRHQGLAVRRTLQLVGKLASPRRINAVTAGHLI